MKPSPTGCWLVLWNVGLPIPLSFICGSCIECCNSELTCRGIEFPFCSHFPWMLSERGRIGLVWNLNNAYRYPGRNYAGYIGCFDLAKNQMVFGHTLPTSCISGISNTTRHWLSLPPRVGFPHPTEKGEKQHRLCSQYVVWEGARGTDFGNSICLDCRGGTSEMVLYGGRF